MHLTNTVVSKSLVLVVGAGGSKEVGLPLGSELKNTIAEALDIRYTSGQGRTTGDGLIDDVFRIFASSLPRPQTNDINSFLRSARRVAVAMPLAISIDNFIDAHRDDKGIALCGKLAIVRAILSSEQGSTLYVNRQSSGSKIRFEDSTSTWFLALFQLLTENCDVHALPARFRKVSIVTFNYDRCIEHYLHESLQNYYGVSRDEATEILSFLDIHHPYGSVGQLDWQSVNQGVAFGGDVDAHSLIRLAQGIKTFTEGVDPSRIEINIIRSTVLNAQRLAFLGFAFHKLNLELLFGQRDEKYERRSFRIYATSLGLSKSDLDVIADEISNMTTLQSVQFRLCNPISCAELFREYKRSLSFP